MPFSLTVQVLLLNRPLLGPPLALLLDKMAKFEAAHPPQGHTAPPLVGNLE